MSRNISMRVWLAAALFIVAGGGEVPSAAAQTVSRSPAAAGTRDPAEAQRALDAGRKAFESGKHAQAVQALSVALQGGLPKSGMAKAFYYRGLAYRKSGKSALAIADLTSAIWLKGGLSDRERADAMAARAAAYREAGVTEDGVPPVTAAAESTPAAGMPPSATSTDGPALAAVPSGEAPSSGSGWGVGSLFSGISDLFGGGSQQPPKAASSPAPPAASASGPSPAEQTSALPSPAQAAVSSWSQTTEVAPQQPERNRKSPPAAASPASKPGRAASASGAGAGSYRLQVATVRTRQEAEAVAARLRSGQRAALGGGRATVDEAVVGNMGTFYRVQVGPYRTAEEPRRVCQTLKASGFDCFVTAQ